MNEDPYQFTPVQTGTTIQPEPLQCPVCGRTCHNKVGVFVSYLIGPGCKCDQCKSRIWVCPRSPINWTSIIYSQVVAILLTLILALTGLTISKDLTVDIIFGASTSYLLLSVALQFRTDRVALHVCHATSSFASEFRRICLLIICFIARMIFGTAVGWHAYGLVECGYWISDIQQSRFGPLVLYFVLPFLLNIMMLTGFGMISTLAFTGRSATELILFFWFLFCGIAFIAETELLPPLIRRFGPPGTNHVWCNWFPYSVTAWRSLPERAGWICIFMACSGLFLWALRRSCGVPEIPAPNSPTNGQP